MTRQSTLHSPHAVAAGPVVSVVVPGLNVAEFVGDALSGLARQFADPRALEVIFVDDGSVDGSSEIVEGYSARLSNLRLLRNEAPLGLSAARNQGMAVATGRYLGFLDADDWFAPGHLTVLAEAIEQIGCDFVRCDVIKSRGVERTLVRAPQAVRGVALDPRDGILPSDRRTMVDHAMACCGIYRRELFEDGHLDFSEVLRTAEDRPWTWNLHLKARSYAVIDTPGFFYRRGVPGSLTQIVDDRRLDYLNAYAEIRTMVEQDAETERFMPKVIQSVLAMTEHHLESFALMDEDVQRNLIERAREQLMTFDEAQLEAVAVRLSPVRKALLAKILEGFEPWRVAR